MGKRITAAFEKIGKAIIMAYSRLPMRMLYWQADVVYFCMYKILRYRIKTVRNNLRSAFPTKEETELLSIEKRFYKHLADYFFETIKGLTISDEELKRRLVFRNPEVVTNYTDSGAHIGNWEWFTVLPLTFNVPIQTFYQEQRNKFAEDITLSVRTRRNITAVESHKGFRFMYKCMKEGITNITLILGDQCPHYGAKKYYVDFMGMDTPFLVGPEMIARKINQVLIYPSFSCEKRGYYEVTLHVIDDNVPASEEKAPTARFAALLEDNLHKQPELWLWSHRRWKYTRAEWPDALEEEEEKNSK